MNIFNFAQYIETAPRTSLQYGSQDGLIQDSSFLSHHILPSILEKPITILNNDNSSYKNSAQQAKRRAHLMEHAFVKPLRNRLNESLVREIVQESSQDPIDNYLQELKEKGDAELKENGEFLRIKGIIEGLMDKNEDLQRELKYNLDLLWVEKANSTQNEQQIDCNVIFMKMMDNIQTDIRVSTDKASKIDLPSDRQTEQQSTDLKGFPHQAVEISKVLRQCLKQIPNLALSRTLFQTFIWSCTWISQLLEFWSTKTRSLRDNAKNLEDKLTADLQAFKQHLEDESRFKIEVRDKEIQELQARYERLREEKEGVSDVLRHKLKELEIMNKAVEFDDFSIKIKELQLNLEEQDRTRMLMSPKIDQIQQLAKLFEQFERRKTSEAIPPISRQNSIPKRNRKFTADDSNQVSFRGTSQDQPFGRMDSIAKQSTGQNVILIVRKEYIGGSSSQQTNQNTMRDKEERVQIETNADYKEIKRAVKEGNLKSIEVKPEPPLKSMKSMKQAPSTNSQDLSHLNEPQPEVVIERCPKCNYSQTKGSSKYIQLKVITMSIYQRQWIGELGKCCPYKIYERDTYTNLTKDTLGTERNDFQIIFSNLRNQSISLIIIQHLQIQTKYIMKRLRDMPEQQSHGREHFIPILTHYYDRIVRSFQRTMNYSAYTSTQLTMHQDPLASLDDLWHRKIHNRKLVTIGQQPQPQSSSPERQETQPTHLSQKQDAATSSSVERKQLDIQARMQSKSKDETDQSISLIRVKNVGGKLFDAQILRALESSIDELVRFEVSDQSPYAFQMRKILSFKDYLLTFLLHQYGLKTIADKTFDHILQRLFSYCTLSSPYAAILFNCLSQPYPHSTKLWSLNKQHVALYAMVVFGDAQLATSKSLAQLREDVLLPSSFRKVSKLHDAGALREAYNAGAVVNINCELVYENAKCMYFVNVFDLIEQVTKPQYQVATNAVAARIIEGIKPGQYIKSKLQGCIQYF